MTARCPPLVGGLAGLSWLLPRRPSNEEPEPAELTGPPDDEEPEPVAESAEGCVLYTAESLHEARLVLDSLAEASIDARLFNEHLIGAMGELPFSQCWPKIWLTDGANRKRARAIIDEYESRKRRVSDATLHCDACGEESPDNFEVCWSCRVPFEEA